MTVVHFHYTDDKPLAPRPILSTPIPNESASLVWGAVSVLVPYAIVFGIIWLASGH